MKENKLGYKAKANRFLKSGFWMAGLGHFDLTLDEVALILKLVETESFKDLDNLYKKLANERL